MAFVVSGGRLQAINQPTLPAMYPGLATLQWTDDRHVEYAELFRAQPNVRTVVQFLSRNIAQLGLHLFRRLDDADRQRLTDHPLAHLLAAPCPPKMKLSRYRVIERLVSDLAIFDDAFWVKVRNPYAGGVGYLVPIPPNRISPLGDNWLAAGGWRIHGSRGDIDVDADNVVHFRGYNPDDARVGLSPMETLRELLIEEWEAGRQRQQMWRNGARTSGIIERPDTAPDWSDTAEKNFRAEWEAQFTGDGPQAGGTPILKDGMTYKPAGLDPKQAQYIESRKLTREEVASAYFIPPPMVGILEHATFSNIEEQHKMLYQDTLGPWLVMIAEDIQLQLLPDFDDVDDVYLEFNIGEKLKGSFEEQARSIQTLVGAPVLTRNEGRSLLNRNALSGGDGLITPLNVTQGGQASPTDSAPDTSPGTAAQQATRVADAAPARARVKAQPDRELVADTETVFSDFFTRQSRSVLSRLGGKMRHRRKASAAELLGDLDRWNDDLAEQLLVVNRAMATAAGQATLRQVGLDPDTYDEARTVAWLRANARGVAAGTNALTARQLDDALADDDPVKATKSLFDIYASSRAAQLSVSHSTGITSWGSAEAARQTERPATKTWVTGPNPRPEHARMNGETVPLDELFSNGADFPGDSSLPEEDRAGCNCSVDIEVELPD